MTDNNKYNIADLVNYALDQKPLEFQDLFNHLMVDKISDSVANRKVEIAQSLFASPEPDLETETEEEGDDGETS